MALTDVPCLDAVLCGLSAPVAAALSATMDALKATLTAELARLQAELILLDVASVPLLFAQRSAQAVIDSARSASDLLPLALIAQCTPVGEIMQTVDAALVSTLADAQGLTDEANRALGVRAFIVARQTQIQTLIDNIDQVQITLGACA